MALRWNIDRDRGMEGAALATCIGLAAAALWLVVRLVWLIVPRGDALDVAAGRVGVGASGPVPAQAIAKWHLFGNTPGLAGSGSGANASTLSMILRGTLAERDPAAGMAVISDTDRGERAFRAGEELASGVKLARVYPDHIVLVHAGVEETLTLTRDENLMPGNIVRQPTTAARGTRSAANANAQSSAPADAPAPASTQTVRAPADWQQTVDRLRQNPDELTRRMQIVPVLDGGKLSGVRVAAGADMTLISALGLRAGDVVTAVNGAPVDSIARGQQIVESLRTASSARVTVLRDGKPTDITIGLK